MTQYLVVPDGDGYYRASAVGQLTAGAGSAVKVFVVGGKSDDPMVVSVVPPGT